MLRYAITDRHLFPGEEGQRQSRLVAQALRLQQTGVDLLQIREKDLPAPQLADLAVNLRQALIADALASTHPLAPLQLLLNGPATLAAETRLPGLHLRSGTTADDVRNARSTYAAAGLPPPILSLSCHSLADISAAAPLHVDYLLLGPIFEKVVRGQRVAPGLGLDLLHRAALLTPRAKLLALGGVTEANTPLCLAAGAAGIASIRLFL